MNSRIKIEEVQFYLDRSQDSMLAVLRSIIGNPRLQLDERMSALKLMGDFHQQVADFIWQKICEGECKGYALLSDQAEAKRQEEARRQAEAQTASLCVEQVQETN